MSRKHKMPSSEVYTLCFHTRDAVERDDSSLTFEITGDRLRLQASKVALGSCEFPMVQWTIEEDWCRLYLNEGVRLDDDVATRSLHIVARMPEGSSIHDQPVRVVVPPRLNRTVSTNRRAAELVVECHAPHGLWNALGRLNDAVVHDGVQLLCGRGGTVTVTDPSAFRYLSEVSFAVRVDKDGDHARYVFVPTCVSPTRLCEWITHAARGVLEETHGVRVAARYDASSDRVVLTAAADVAGTVVRVLPNAFSARLGLSTTPLRLSTTAPHEWPSEPSQLWDYVEMPPGFYAPCHRPMCTGQPMRFGTELETAVNRFYFPISNASTTSLSPATPHGIVFADPSGRIHVCRIPCGRYSPFQLCRHLEMEMTRVVHVFDSSVSFYVTRDSTDRVVFSCERASSPAPFSLLFHHPLSIDPERLGFAAQPLHNSDTYVAPRATRCAFTDQGRTRTVSNLIRVSELGAQKRFRLHAVAPSTMTCMTDGSSTLDEVVLYTHVGGMPFSHGVQVGDVVHLNAVVSAPTLHDMDGNERPGVTTTVARLPDHGVDAVALPSRDNDPPDVLRLHCPRVEGLGDEHASVQVTVQTEPWNLCFCRPRTVPPALMGFPRRAVQWGVDGSVCDARDRRLPPFEAPNTHSLDHPDYVLMTFSEGAGATLEHTYDGESRAVFCKLSLYPLFREERMLPRDTTLARGNVGRFTLAFWNPDLRTPYRFHGAEFSFSLNFVSQLP